MFNSTDMPAPEEMAAPTLTAHKPTLLTYCYNGRMAYVPAAEAYDDAVDIAQEVFPALKSVRRSSLSFSIKFTPISNDESIPDAEIQVTPATWTWGQIVTDLPKYNVVHLAISAERDDALACCSERGGLFWMQNRGNVGPTTSYAAQVVVPGRSS
ncbi:hypothetical protein OF83DRAFT_1151388 [Amylostereum chailletii]|nr:hypothetical protein OF83DRAFT_1151388 [Amylostereum chailletii]